MTENIYEKLVNKRLDENTDEEKSSKVIVSKIQNNRTGFAALDNNVQSGILFDDKKIEVYRQGKTINIQDWINKGNNDITIYDVLAKYHGDMQLTQEQLNHNMTKLSDVFAKVNSLKDVFEIQKTGEKAWNDLPLSIRREFDNDMKKFMNNGESWVNKKIEEATKIQKEKEKEVENG